MDVLADRVVLHALSATVSAVRAELPAIEPAGRGGGLRLTFARQRPWLLQVLEADVPFTPERGPLVRGRLIRRGARDHVLLVTPHPLVSDAGSPGVFVHELGGSPTVRASGRLAGSPGRLSRAEFTRGIDIFPRPAAWPGARGAMRLSQTRFTGVPKS